MTKLKRPGAQPGNQNAAKPDADKLVEHSVNVTRLQKQYLLHIGSAGLRRLLDAAMAALDHNPSALVAQERGRRTNQN